MFDNARLQPVATPLAVLWARLLAAGGSGQEEKRIIRVGRRRRSESTRPEGRERAAAPQRRRPSGPGGTTPPSGGSSYGGGAPSPRPIGGGLPGGLPRSPLLLIGLIILLLVFGGSLLFQQGGQDAGEGVSDEPAIALPTAPPPATNQPPPAAGANGQTWLVMLYQDADDKILEKDIYVDLNEAERIGSSERVQIVAQVDRYQAGYQGDGNWTCRPIQTPAAPNWGNRLSRVISRMTSALWMTRRALIFSNSVEGRLWGVCLACLADPLQRS
jgi:hypothetical protein